jgi:4-hydroxy-tetrahydrodipicolinate synthase
MQIRGAIPPMLTPTTSEMDVDTNTLRDFTAFLVEGGVHALFPMGTTGEFASLTHQQQETVIQAVVEESRGLPVLAGCGGTSVRAVSEQLDSITDAGADVAVVVTPYYFQTTQEGVQRFYEQVALEASIPIYLYNIPQLTGFALERATVERLAEHPNIIGIKDSSGDFPFFMDLLDTTASSFTVLQGIPTFAVNSLARGADGIIAGLANIFPKLVSEIYNTHDSGDYLGAQKRQSKVLFPVIRSMHSMPTVPALKYLSAKVGRDLGRTLPPLPNLNSEQCDRLDTCLQTVMDTEFIGEEEMNRRM